MKVLLVLVLCLALLGCDEGRYQIVSSQSNEVWRLDTRNGDLERCKVSDFGGSDVLVRCSHVNRNLEGRSMLERAWDWVEEKKGGL